MIINFEPDEAPGDELFHNLKNRYVNQKFIYFDSGAAGYYSNEFYQPSSELFINFVSNQISEISKQIPGQKTAFISLGCGNSFEESKILANSHKDVTLFAIDSSATMLGLSEKTLEKHDFNKVLIQGDFTNSDFQKGLIKLLGEFNKRVFYISGFTFGNFDSGIIPLISNMMNPGDLLIFYVITIIDLNLYHNNFVKDGKDTLKNKEKILAYFEPLRKFKIERNSGKMVLDHFKEKDIGALCLQYCFQFSRKSKN